MMKTIITTFSFLLVLSSCNPIPDKTSPDLVNELEKQFKPILHGVWVQADYMSDIEKTKSPFKSGEKLAFITQLIIDTSGNSTDSIPVGITLGNHEGSDLILYFKEGKTPTSLVTNINGFEEDTASYELGYEVNSVDTSLVIYHFTENQKLIDKIKYIKVAEVSTAGSLEDGFQYMVNKKLVTGSYLVTDSAGVERSVRMINEGIITGLPGFGTYYVITDFVGSECNTDKICFDIQTNLQSCFAFKISNDTISLYKTSKDEADTLTMAEHAHYRFVKQ